LGPTPTPTPTPYLKVKSHKNIIYN